MFKFTGGWYKPEKYPLVVDRFEVMSKHVKGKKVLDCGAGGVSIQPETEWWQNNFLHKKLKEVSEKCVGIDNDQSAVDTLTAMGYDIRFGDVEKVDLIERFDVVVAGELIEHLSNPGLFLNNAMRHLKPGGKLILTTPNPWHLGCLVRLLCGRKIVANATHVAWYDKMMLDQLLARHGFSVNEFYWYQRVIRGAYHLVRLRPSLSCNLILVASRGN